MVLTSQYPLDKVIYQHTLSIPIPAFDFADVNILHGLAFTPLVRMQWSTDPNFTTAYGPDGGPRDSTGSPGYQTGVYAIGNRIFVTTTNRFATPVTLYIRIFGFMPSNANASVPSTSVQGAKFVFNTAYNYMKLFSKGITSVPSGSAVRTVNHGLGYIPTVMLWGENTLGTFPFVFNNVFPFSGSGEFNIDIDTQNVTYTADSTFDPIVMHHRIYLD